MFRLEKKGMVTRYEKKNLCSTHGSNHDRFYVNSSHGFRGRESRSECDCCRICQNTKAWWEDFVTAFNEDNPGINLNVEVVSWNDIYTVVNTRIQGNNAPDILNIDVFADYQADGLLLPAQDYVSEETYAKMYPSFVGLFSVIGRSLIV